MTTRIVALLAVLCLGGCANPELEPVRAAPGDVVGLAFSPDGARLAWVGDGNDVAIASVASRNVVRHLPLSSPGIAVAFTPEGKLVTVNRAWVRFWNAENGALESAFEQPTTVAAFALSRDASQFAVACRRSVRVLDSSGRLVRRLWHPTDVLALAFTASGRSLLTGTSDGGVWRWSVATGRLERTGKGRYFEHEWGPIVALATAPFAEDEWAAVYVDDAAKDDLRRSRWGRPLGAGHVWSTWSPPRNFTGREAEWEGYEELREETETWPPTPARPDVPRFGLTFLPQPIGETAILAPRLEPISADATGWSGGQEPREWLDRFNGEPRAGGEPIFGVAVSPDGALLATGGRRGRVRLWGLTARTHTAGEDLAPRHD